MNDALHLSLSNTQQKKRLSRRFFCARAKLDLPLLRVTLYSQAQHHLTGHDMASQTFLTVAEAAIRVDKSRQTLFDKIKKGQLSATVNADGIKVIDVSELLRVFGRLLSDDELSQNQANKAGQADQSGMTSALHLELELARLRLAHAEKELATANRQIEDMRVRERQSIDDRTQLLGVIERQTLLLAAPKPAAPPRAKAAPKPAPAAQKPAPRASAKVTNKPTAKTVTKTATKVSAKSKPMSKKK